MCIIIIITIISSIISSYPDRTNKCMSVHLLEIRDYTANIYNNINYGNYDQYGRHITHHEHTLNYSNNSVGTNNSHNDTIIITIMMVMI